MLSLSTEQIRTAKETTIRCLQAMSTDINRQVSNGIDLPMRESRISLVIESETSASFPTYSSLDFEFLRTYFQQEFSGEKFADFRPALDEIGLFVVNSSNLLNPQATLFGTVVTNYFTTVTEHYEEDWESLFPLQFDNTVFETCWNGIVSWISPIPLVLKIIYPIFNIQLSGEPFLFNSEQKLWFTIPTNEERMALADVMRVAVDPYAGVYTAIDKLTWVQSCSGWIEGELQVARKYLETSLVFQKDLSPQFDLLHPMHFEEAFALLGYSPVAVHYFMLNDPYSFRFIYMDPPLGGRATSSAGISPQYPNWMTQRFFPPTTESELKLSDEIRFFLQAYPVFRLSLPPDSIEALSITRFFRSIRATTISEAILEAVIGIEALLTQGSTDASLQFRLHTSWFLGRNFAERQQIDHFCKTLYRIRSQIVHESGPAKGITKTANRIGGLQKTKGIAEDLLRLIILKALHRENESLKLLKRKEIVDAVLAARLGGDLDIPKGIFFELTFKEFLQNHQELMQEKE
ncbi:MAG: hypothetical protein ACE5OZ_18920 [Candidatus Heimdallarchaeota archaeon]